ncbi:MAG: hypothetical protein LBF05_03390 [Tannerella sp.]|jgi:hypothetical protein|nr:hypothetical protein [Tannerella sp.]
MLEFDFSGLDTSDEESFSGKVQDAVCLFLNMYEKIIPDSASMIRRIDEEKDLGIAALTIAFDAAFNRMDDPCVRMGDPPKGKEYKKE